MGIETILLGASLAVGAANVVVQQDAARKAANAQENANQVQQASEDYKNTLARRQAAKDLRLRQARIAASAAGGGVGGSSGESGAVSGLGSSYGAGVATQYADVLTSNTLTDLGQQKADALQKADNFNAWASLFQKGTNTVMKYPAAFGIS